MDLSLKDEIECLVQELQEIESHSIKSFIGTKNKKYLKILNKAREIRTKWMEKIFIEEKNSQKWCISKHSLSASKRATEVATKLLSIGKEDESKEALLDSAEIIGMYYSLEDSDKNNKLISFLKGGKNV